MPKTTRAAKELNVHLPTCCAPEPPPPLAKGADLVRAFRALGDETRLEIIRCLARAPETCVCHVSEGFPQGQATISHHLKVLREAGLVEFRKRGVWAYYFLRQDLPEPIRAALSAIVAGDSDDNPTSPQ